MWMPTVDQLEEYLALANDEERAFGAQVVSQLRSFVPRPDQPNDYDEQTAFINDLDNKFTICLGGTGCLAPEQPAWVEGVGMVPVAEIKTPFVTRSMSSEGPCLAYANRPFVKGTATLFRCVLSNGEQFISTAEHKVLTMDGQWVSVSQVYERGLDLPCVRPRKFYAYHPLSTSGTYPSVYLQDDDRSFHRGRDLKDRCSRNPHRNDARPLSASGSGRLLPQQPICARALAPHDLPLDDLVCGLADSQTCQSVLPRATTGFSHPDTIPLGAFENRVFCTPSKSTSDFDRAEYQCRSLTIRRSRTTSSFLQSDNRKHSSEPCNSPSVALMGDTVQVIAMEKVREGPFYDFTVHGTHCYVTAGIVHKNSGKTMAAAIKSANYILTTSPPRRRCPFWVIGESYDQVCQATWAEKLSELIPPENIHSFDWYKTKRKWPFAVMLKHPTIKNEVGWVLEFKSYEQGFSGMKAVSIGGYWCNEEIPYHLMSEIHGRCRDYDSPGWADFTPIECKDPEWPETYDNPPRGWKFYHLNSLLNTALAPGFMERYLESVPEDMRELRTIGRFTILSGAVFKEWKKSTHVIEPFRIPRDWRKVRSIDFGFNNAFAALWGAKDHDGRWYIYDEHYESRRLNAYHAEAINRRPWDESQPWFGPTYTDHDAQQRAEMAILGINCTPANKSVNQGIEHLRSLMMVQNDGKPMFYVFNTCKNLIREIPGYRWPDGTLNRNPQDVPMGIDDHSVDAVRYMVYSDRLGGLKISPETRYELPETIRHGVQLRRRVLNGR